MMEVPHYGRKCLILSKNDVIFFSFQESHVWFGLVFFLGHKWQKPNLNYFMNLVDKKASSLFGQYFTKTTTVAWETWRFLT